MQEVKWLNKQCNNCKKRLNSWDKRLSDTLAYRYAVCEVCIAKEYDMDVKALRSRMEEYYDLRPCQGI